MSNLAIQIHPEIRKLAGENNLLREELARLLAEVDNLWHTVKPNLFALYQTRIGLWELRVFKAKFAVARLKRKIELVQASLNRCHAPDLRVIEGGLELDFQAWQARIKEAQERIQAAEAHLKHLMPAAESSELKTLYHCLVKMLHPDLNPNLTGIQKLLWHRVQSAWLAGDLLEMRVLALLARKNGPVLSAATTIEELRAEQKTLQTQIEELLERIESIGSQPPFTWREQLEDEAWVAMRRMELELKISELEARRRALEAHLRKLLSGSHYGKCFGPN